MNLCLKEIIITLTKLQKEGTENMYQMFQRLELPIKWYKTLIARAAKIRLIFLSLR